MLTIDFRESMPSELLGLLDGAFVIAVLDDTASLARAKWIKLAQTELHSSKRDYIDGIQNVTGDGFERSISLVGLLPNMVEHGIEPYDLRTTLLGEGKGKVSADGLRYRAIPFRHGTPGSQGQAGAPMGSSYGPLRGHSRSWAVEGRMSVGAAVSLGRAVYKQAKRLRGKERLPGRTMIAVPRGGGAVRAVPLLAPHHTTDIYAGMKRSSKKYKTATQGQYITFRTISERNPIGWWHPGIEARMLHRRVEAHVGKLVPAIIQSAVDAALRGR